MALRISMMDLATEVVTREEDDKLAAIYENGEVDHQSEVQSWVMRLNPDRGHQIMQCLWGSVPCGFRGLKSASPPRESRDSVAELSHPPLNFLPLSRFLSSVCVSPSLLLE